MINLCHSSAATLAAPRAATACGCIISLRRDNLPAITKPKLETAGVCVCVCLAVCVLHVCVCLTLCVYVSLCVAATCS